MAQEIYFNREELNKFKNCVRQNASAVVHSTDEEDDGVVGDVGQGVLRDRRVLAEEGVVVVVVTVDISSGRVITGPEIITRGWVYAPEAEDLLDEACDTVADAVEASLADGERSIDALEQVVRRATGKFVNTRTKRRPMIVPVVMET